MTLSRNGQRDGASVFGRVIPRRREACYDRSVRVLLVDDVPVIILTSDATPALERHARLAGAAAVLQKPCGAAELSRTLARVVRK